MKGKNRFIYMYLFQNGLIYIGQTFKDSGRYGNPEAYRGQAVYDALISQPYQKRMIRKGLDAREADFWESFYIGYYGSLNPDVGYNRTQGGIYESEPYEDLRKKIPNAYGHRKLSLYAKKQKARRRTIRE